MPNSYAHLNLDTRTDEYSDPYEGNYGEEYAHSHHHDDGYVLCHIGTEPMAHTHADLSSRHGHAVVDEHAFRYATVFGYENPSRAAALSMAVYLTTLAHGFPRETAARHAVRTYHAAVYYHETAAWDTPPVPAKPVPDAPVPDPTWQHNGKHVALVQEYASIEKSQTHEHPIERESGLGRVGETWSHPHPAPEPGHTHRYMGLGPAFNPDGSTPVVRFPHYIGSL